MLSVIVEFQYGEEFDPAHIAGIARDARGRFEGLPRLRQKAFTIDEQHRRATNVYLWESEDAARGFFTTSWSIGSLTSTACVRPSAS